MGNREGPSITVRRSCFGCKYEHGDSYAVQGDSGIRVYCVHPSLTSKRIGDTTWDTPDWCPLLPAEARPQPCPACRAAVVYAEAARHKEEADEAWDRSGIGKPGSPMFYEAHLRAGRAERLAMQRYRRAVVDVQHTCGYANASGEGAGT